MNTVVIVGGGPAGLMTAITLREHGWGVNVVEEDRAVGQPENCTGLISSSGLKELKLKPEECIKNKVNGALIHSPNGTTLDLTKKGVAFVLDRKEFDKFLYKKAVSLGATVELQTKLIDIRKNTLFVQKKKRGELKKTMFLIGADGVNSATRKLAGFQFDQNQFVHSYQEKADGSFNPDKVEMFFGSFAPGFFGWIVPESDKIARIGVGCSIGQNPKTCFDKFKKHANLEFKPFSKSSFLIPCGPPMRNLVKDNVLLDGDAAFQTKATTGGGLVMGMLAGRECGETISEHLKNNKPLTDYNARLSAINKELNTHWKIRSFLNKQSDEQLDKLFEKVKKSGIESFLEEHGDMDKPSQFIRTLIRKPSMWRLAGLALRFR